MVSLRIPKQRLLIAGLWLTPGCLREARNLRDTVAMPAERAPSATVRHGGLAWPPAVEGTVRAMNEALAVLLSWNLPRSPRERELEQGWPPAEMDPHAGYAARGFLAGSRAVTGLHHPPAGASSSTVAGPHVCGS